LPKKKHQNCQKHEREDKILSHQQSGKHLDQEDMASSAFANKELVVVSFNETT